jgi:hypothetical protein
MMLPNCYEYKKSALILASIYAAIGFKSATFK